MATANVNELKSLHSLLSLRPILIFIELKVSVREPKQSKLSRVAQQVPNRADFFLCSIHRCKHDNREKFEKFRYSECKLCLSASKKAEFSHRHDSQSTWIKRSFLHKRKRQMRDFGTSNLHGKFLASNFPLVCDFLMCMCKRRLWLAGTHYGKWKLPRDTSQPRNENENFTEFAWICFVFVVVCSVVNICAKRCGEVCLFGCGFVCDDEQRI